VDKTNADIKKEKELLKEQKKENEQVFKDMAELQKKLTLFEEKKEIDIEIAKDEIRTKLQDEFEYRINLLKAEHRREIEVLECSLENQEDIIDNLKAQVKVASDNLKDSLTNITQLASKTVENYHTEKSITNMKEFAKSYNDKK
jgi:translation initiation factor 2 alpha subunit (eIF-2alpha)